MPSKPKVFFLTPPPCYGTNWYFIMCDKINALPSYIHELANIYGLPDFYYMDTFHYFGGISQKGADDFTTGELKDFGPVLN